MGHQFFSPVYQIWKMRIIHNNHCWKHLNADPQHYKGIWLFLTISFTLPQHCVILVKFKVYLSSPACQYIFHNYSPLLVNLLLQMLAIFLESITWLSTTESCLTPEPLYLLLSLSSFYFTSIKKKAFPWSLWLFLCSLISSAIKFCHMWKWRLSTALEDTDQW